MPNESNQITQIYELKAIGDKAVIGSFEAVNAAIQQVIKSKAEAGGGKPFIDPAILKQLTAGLDDVAESGGKVKKSVGENITLFQQLQKDMKAAQDRAREAGLEFGTNSEQFREAAATAASYKAEILELNNALKNPPSATVGIVSTDNLAALEAEQLAISGVANELTDLEVIQAEAANEATAMAGAVNRYTEATVASTGAIETQAAAVEMLITPYAEYTGTLDANIIALAEQKGIIAANNAELAATALRYEAGAISLAEYEAIQVNVTQNTLQAKQRASELNQIITAQVKYTQAAAGSVDKLSSELGILRNAYRSLNVEQQKSGLGQQLVADIQLLDVQVKKAEGTVGNFQRNVGNYAGKAFGYVRQLANILPGIGLAGLFGLAFEGIQSLFESFTKTTPKLNTFVENLKNLDEVSKQANKSIAEQTTQLNTLYNASQDASQPIEQRKRAIEALQKLFPEYFGNLTQEQILNGKAGDSYRALTKDIVDNARAVAANAKIVDLEAKRLDAEDQKRKIRSANAAEDARVKGTKSITDVEGNVLLSQTEAEQRKTNKERADAAIKVIDKQVQSLDAQEQFLSKFTGTSKSIEATIDKVIGKQKTGLEQLKKDLEKVYHDISLTAKDDPGYAALVARRDDLKRQIKDIEGTLKPDTSAAKAAKKALADQKKATAELKKEQEEAARVKKAAFDQATADLKANLDEQTAIIQENNRRQQADSSLDPTQKAQAELDADKAVLALKRKFAGDMLFLEQQQGLNINKTQAQLAKDRLKTEGEVYDDEKKLAVSTLATIQATTDKAVTDIKLKYDGLRSVILNDTTKSKSDKDQALAVLDKIESIEIAGRVAGGANFAVAAAKKLLDQGLITSEAFEKIYAAANKGQADLNDKVKETQKSYLSLQALITGKAGAGFAKLLNFDPLDGGAGGEKAKLFAQAITSAFSTAQQAENDYFANEQNNLKKSSDATLKQLDIQQQAALARATSQAEEDAINTKFQTKRDAANKAAFEKNKKIQRAQAEVNLAAQLSNLAVIAFSPGPANILTLGAAGFISYGALALSALAGFALNLKRINSATYEFGGDVPTKGGRFKGKPHSRGGTPFTYQSQSFEAELGELAVIRTKGAPANRHYTISGNHTQIASALNQLGGGVGFANGASVKRFAFGGVPGAGLSAPLYIPTSSPYSEGNQEMIHQIRMQNEWLKQIAFEAHNRIDNIQVQQVTSTVTNAQRKQVSQQSVATIGRRRRP